MSHTPSFSNQPSRPSAFPPFLFLVSSRDSGPTDPLLIVGRDVGHQEADAEGTVAGDGPQATPPVVADRALPGPRFEDLFVDLLSPVLGEHCGRRNPEQASRFSSRFGFFSDV